MTLRSHIAPRTSVFTESVIREMHRLQLQLVGTRNNAWQSEFQICEKADVGVASPIQSQGLANYGFGIDVLKWPGAFRRSSIARERSCNATQAIDFDENLIHILIEDTIEVRALICTCSSDVLHGEFDGRERILDFVRDLPRHLAPCLQPVRPQDLGHIFGDHHLFVAVGERDERDAICARIAIDDEFDDATVGSEEEISERLKSMLNASPGRPDRSTTTRERASSSGTYACP